MHSICKRIGEQKRKVNGELTWQYHDVYHQQTSEGVYVVACSLSTICNKKNAINSNELGKLFRLEILIYMSDLCQIYISKSKNCQCFIQHPRTIFKSEYNACLKQLAKEFVFISLQQIKIRGSKSVDYLKRTANPWNYGFPSQNQKTCNIKRDVLPCLLQNVTINNENSEKLEMEQLEDSKFWINRRLLYMLKLTWKLYVELYGMKV